MAKPSTARRIILRADLQCNGRKDVGHTLEISDTTVFVRTDEPADVGDRIQVRLSFPRLLEPLVVQADVIGKSAASEPGDVAGLTLELSFPTPHVEGRFAALIARLDNATTASAAGAAPPEFKILLVEDSDFIRDMFILGVRKYFRRRPVKVAVEVAMDGEMAWEMVQQNPYDLAIIDFYLPSLGGSQLVDRVRSVPRLRRLPLVGISVGGAEARDAFLKAGADIFLDKPIILRDLYSTIELMTLTGAAA